MKLKTFKKQPFGGCDVSVVFSGIFVVLTTFSLDFCVFLISESSKLLWEKKFRQGISSRYGSWPRFQQRGDVVEISRCKTRLMSQLLISGYGSKCRL